MEVIKTAHGMYCLHYHVVWVCKDRRKILKPGVCSYIRKTLPWLSKVYWNETIVWSPGYFVSSVGIDEQTIRNYVEHQGHQDSGQLRQEL